MAEAGESVSPRYRGTRLVVLVVVIIAILVVSLSGSTAATTGTDPACADGSDGGPVYVTDTGLSVVDNDSAPDEAYPSFPDDETVHLADVGYPNVTFSASGDAELRLENRTTERICLAAVDATDHEMLSIRPDWSPSR